MAVLIKEYNDTENQYDNIGVIYDGEYHGDERLEPEFSNLNLGAENAEADIADEYDSRVLQAVQVDDTEVTLSEFTAGGE